VTTICLHVHISHDVPSRAETRWPTSNIHLVYGGREDYLEPIASQIAPDASIPVRRSVQPSLQARRVALPLDVSGVSADTVPGHLRSIITARAAVGNAIRNVARTLLASGGSSRWTLRGASRGMVHISHLSKVYRIQRLDRYALRDVSVHVRKGEFVSMTGPSGCGKTTLLTIAGLIEDFDQGDYWLDGMTDAALYMYTLAKTDVWVLMLAAMSLHYPTRRCGFPCLCHSAGYWSQRCPADVGPSNAIKRFRLRVIPRELLFMNVARTHHAAQIIH
jgi:hypothetical protein